ncbi:cellulose biosynthesis protein BcsD [Burkholderia ubonensis]|uniref:cellulose biosynthesis protein BcsD n=1 Tax=Burkholderia ubonensis TaxID=101571 RepID=UPI0007521B84|nr:cellulose biosynthesis protein BcsD [Burkholderia ubonensis]KWN65875.1 hypothetical protein WM23_07740 [Burkholderia ubonensis]
MSEQLSLSTVFDALHDQLLSQRWPSLLHVLAAECESQLDKDKLRKLMFRIGQRFAANQPLPACTTTQGLAEQLNARWAAIQSGYVELTDENNSVRIAHHGSLLQSFEVDALTWTCAFLQGSYQAWLDALEADALSVVRIETSIDSFVLEFRLLHLTA